MSRLFDVANVIDSDDWYTPAWIFDGLGVTFDIDVAAPDGGAANVPALDHFTVMLGRGEVATAGMLRLAATHGGTTRTLDRAERAA